jgi:MFS family permease
MFDRVPPRLVAVPALLLLAAGLAWFSALPTEPDYLAVFPSLCLVGIAMGALFPAISVGAMGSVPGQELGLASGLVNMSRQLGFTLGVAVLVAVFTGELEGVTGSAGARAAAEGARDAFGSAMRVAALAAVLAIPLALTLRERPRTPGSPSEVGFSANAPKEVSA